MYVLYKAYFRIYADCLWAGTYEIDMNKVDKILMDVLWIVSGAVAYSNIYNLD